MKRILLVILCLLALPVLASHIVGGEFEIKHMPNLSNNNIYRVNLILYFDKLNGLPDARDVSIMARIYRKSDNALMMNVPLSLASEVPVSYTQPECSRGEIITTKITYTTTIQLLPSQFSDSQGYYIVWERCCRNYTITNIYSEPPGTGTGRYAGQTFYLEFPPVVKNGNAFINSSPRLFPPLNDYACPRKPYYSDFAGVDDDGDSLAYSIVTPLNTHSGDPFPPGSWAAPHPNVLWRFPFSSTNVIGGAPDLKISTAGFLTVTPTRQGLYVFAVRCEEYRQGEKIGEVRRDFQMLVVDACPRAEPPQILGKKLGDASFTYDNNMNVTFASGINNNDRCIEVQVSDPDASFADNNFRENVKIKAIPLNFKKDVSGILPVTTSAVLVNGSTSTFNICFEECPYVNGPFQVGIVAYDDACSLPLTDTLKVTVTVLPPPNNRANFITPDTHIVMQEGDAKQTWSIQAEDIDGDAMTMFLLPEPGFNFTTSGMSFHTLPPQQGNFLNAEFSWDPRCDVFDFTRKTEFTVRFLVSDQDFCGFTNPDTLTFTLKIVLPPNADPEIRSNLSASEIENGITRKIFEPLNFKVWGTDTDVDIMTLHAKGKEFELNDYNMIFPTASGSTYITSDFAWSILCDDVDLSLKNEFELSFIVSENTAKCNVYKADTLKIKVTIEPPLNQQPNLHILNTNPQLSFVNNHQAVMVGQEISLGLTATDADRNPSDNIRIEMIEASGPKDPTGYNFEPSEGLGLAQTVFTWNPDCSVFKNGEFENDYTFKFRTFDNRCADIKGDTVEVNFTFKDIVRNDKEFLPPNIITPNGDGCNDFFAMEGLDDTASACGNFKSIHLPIDNCEGRFSKIYIYNRWGKRIFESENRNFRWYALNEAAGVYFYTLEYSHRNYKGTITVHY
jgi:hypothetical protein